VENRHKFFEPYLDKAVLSNISSAVAAKDLGFTETVYKFEDALKEFGLTSPVCVNSNSAGLVIALKALGVKSGDEVIVPRQTFIATGLAVLEVGASPVFCDINIDTGELDLAAVEQQITKDTRAIIFVHWGGNGHNCNTFLELAQKYNVGLIEDAAHAFGANVTFNDKLGRITVEKHFVVFSFQAIKFFTTGDGGCVCSHPNHYNVLKALSWFGIDKNRSKGRRELNVETGLNVSLGGYKYNMNGIQASIGLSNLSNIEERVALRRYRAKLYFEAIEKHTRIRSLIKNKRQIDLGIHWFYPILCKSRQELIDYLDNNNVPSSTIDYRIDVNPIFLEARKDCGFNQAIFDEQFLALCLGDHIPVFEFERFCNVLRKY